MKKPSLSLPMTLGRAAAELAIIVAGVLIALGAQAWWEGRGEATERATALAALDDDLAQIQTLMVRDSVRAEERMTAFRLALDDPAGFAARSDSIVAWDVRALLYLGLLGDATYAFPAWNDLEGSGRLELLPADVRRALSELDQELEQFYFSARDLHAFQLERMDGYLIEWVDSRDILWTEGLGLRRGGRPRLDFLDDPRAQSALTMKLSLVNVARESLHPALARVRALRTMLHSEAPR